MKAEIKYRTFDQLLSEVASDFSTYNLEGMIEPGQLIKVAQRVTYDLGLKVHSTKEKMIYIENQKTRLPDDFYVLNYAFLCTNYKIVSPMLGGRETENVILDGQLCKKCGQPDPTCSCEKTYAVECNTGEKIYVQVIEKRKQETRHYENTRRLNIATSTGRKDALDNTGPDGYIKNGFIYTDFATGDIFLSYQGALEDEEGNLLVVDHPFINEYYEYALKQRILENLFIKGEEVSQKMQLIEQRLRAARNNALSVVNTPDFAEMQKLWETNRKAQYGKYYDMFKSSEYF
jgi:hypothetical protein